MRKSLIISCWILFYILFLFFSNILELEKSVNLLVGELI